MTTYNPVADRAYADRSKLEYELGYIDTDLALLEAESPGDTAKREWLQYQRAQIVSRLACLYCAPQSTD
jgi:hypothetical protein